jgi:hypothetical protein
MPSTQNNTNKRPHNDIVDGRDRQGGALHKKAKHDTTTTATTTTTPTTNNNTNTAKLSLSKKNKLKSLLQRSKQQHNNQKSTSTDNNTNAMKSKDMVKSAGSKQLVKKDSAKDFVKSSKLNTTAATTSSAPLSLSKLQQSMAAKLSGAHFRWINEVLYTRRGDESLELFQQNPEYYQIVGLLSSIDVINLDSLF